MNVRLLVRPPCPALRGWVRQHQFVRLQFAPGTPVPIKHYWPRPAAALAFYPREPEHIGCGLEAPHLRKPRAVLIGQPTVVTQRLVGADSSVYQIEFEPGALYRLIGLPMPALTDRFVDAESLMPRGFSALVECIENEDCPATQQVAAESYLIRLVQASRREAKPGDRVAALLLGAERWELDRLARQHGVTARHLRRQCEERLGVGPRLLARIARFDRLVRSAGQQPHASWLQRAMEAGYHDHQHMARDFRQFTLRTPAQFLRLESGAPERAFGLREA